MTALRVPLRTGVQLARLALGVTTAPVRIGAALIESPQVASRDPASIELDQRRRDGWRLTEVHLARRHTTVHLERDGETDSVEGTTLAFAAYASRVAAGVASARLIRERTP